MAAARGAAMMRVVGNGVLIFTTDDQEQFAKELSEYIGNNRHIQIVAMVGDEHTVYQTRRKYTVVISGASP